jgi:hypothetical protein
MAPSGLVGGYQRLKEYTAPIVRGKCMKLGKSLVRYIEGFNCTVLKHAYKISIPSTDNLLLFEVISNWVNLVIH